MMYWQKLRKILPVTIFILNTIQSKVLLVAFLLCLIVPNQSYAQAGVYVSHSESEWEITLQLEENGYAIKTLESWLAGEYEYRNIHIYRGRWTLDGAIITVKYRDKFDTYRILENVEMQEGFVIGVCPHLLEVVGDIPHRLWLKKCMKFELPE